MDEPWTAPEWFDHVARVVMEAHRLCDGDPVRVTLMLQTCASATVAFVRAMCPPETVADMERLQKVLADDLEQVDSIMAPSGKA